jgi:hypothetical protein
MDPSQVAPPTGRRRSSRVAIVVVAIIGALVVARLLVAPLPSGRSLGWQTAYGFPGAETDSGMVIPIEVERPACAPDGTSWLATPVVTYTPIAVFITIRMAGPFDTSGPGCAVAGDGPLPTVGNYLMGTYVPVLLSEPLGGRVLFDGGGLFPSPRF